MMAPPEKPRDRVSLMESLFRSLDAGLAGLECLDAGGMEEDWGRGRRERRRRRPKERDAASQEGPERVLAPGRQ
ncbi:MAG: hypothetical protein HY927_08680 [Elusimicrobia bacterium]|nr:hypothetical protein [Elusimicrobiota bacterium]